MPALWRVDVLNPFEVQLEHQLRLDDAHRAELVDACARG